MSQKLGKLAHRYAKALLEVVQREHPREGLALVTKQVAEGLDELAKLWREEKDFSLFVVNPMFPTKERFQILQKSVEILVLPQVIERFLKVLFENDRIQALPEISAAFLLLAHKASGLVEVIITTAMALSESEKKEIEGRLLAHIKGKPVYTWLVDSLLLGGMLVSFDGKVIDGSLRGRLEKIERVL